MEVDSLSTLRYCRMSGMDISRSTRKNRKPAINCGINAMKDTFLCIFRALLQGSRGQKTLASPPLFGLRLGMGKI